MTVSTSVAISVSVVASAISSITPAVAPKFDEEGVRTGGCRSPGHQGEDDAEEEGQGDKLHDYLRFVECAGNN